jgi:hypothetical protein
MWEVPSSKERYDCKSSRYALGYDSLFELYLEQKLPGFGGVVSIVGDRSAKPTHTHISWTGKILKHYSMRCMDRC